MKKATVKDYELGNLLFGNSRGNYPVDRKFQDRFCNVLKKAGYDCYGCPDVNSQEELDTKKYCKSFIVRPYWWGDDDSPEVLLPNFECKEIGLELKWYKYALRDSFSNIPFTEKVMKKLEKIVEDKSNF